MSPTNINSPWDIEETARQAWPRGVRFYHGANQPGKEELWRVKGKLMREKLR